MADVVKKGGESQHHKIRITLWSRNPAAVEKVMADLVSRAVGSGPLHPYPLPPLWMGHGGGERLSGFTLPELQLGLGLFRPELHLRLS